MTTYAIHDSATMLRRDLKHLQRYPIMTIATVMVPVLLMLLFVYVFGGALSAAIGGGAYVDYVVPGILLITVGSGSAATAVSAHADMSEGIIARFRTMSISRMAVLTGHVAGSMLRTAVSVVLVIAVALLIGFRPTTGAAQWLLAAGFLALVVLAFTWLAVALGLGSKSLEGASSSTQLLQFGPFLSSTFVAPDTMPVGARVFAEHQPLTPIIETVRGLLFGTPIGNQFAISLAWCGAMALFGYLRSRSLYNRAPEA